MKFLVYFATFFLLINVFATAQSLIRDSCQKAAAKDPKFKIAFCVKSLEENPQSKTAKTLEALVMASAKTAATKTTALKAAIEKILKEKKYAKEAEMPLQDCLQLYTDAVDSLNEASASVKSRNYRTATAAMSAAMDAPSTCETGFKERRTPQKSPVAKESEVLFQTILIPLAFTNMLK
ncbi:unnamed protein product [Cochlearia groenlandica]